MREIRKKTDDRDPVVYKTIGNKESGYTKIQQADAIGYIFKSGFSFVGGMSVYAGYIIDYEGNKEWFRGYAGNIGIGLELSAGAFAVFSTTNERFKVEDLKGRGEGWSFPILGAFGGGVDGTYGDDKFRMYSLSAGADLNAWWSGSTTTFIK